MIKKILKNQDGMALSLVIMIFAVVSIVAASSLTIAISETKQSVSNEKYMENYYTARSAVDIVSTDLINQINELEAAKPVTEAGIEAYNRLKMEFNDRLATGSVTVNGLSSGDVTVNFNKSIDGVIEVYSTYMNDGRSSTSKVRIGTVDVKEESVPKTQTTSDYAIYAVGDIDIGTNFTATGADVGFGGKPKNKANTYTFVNKVEDPFEISKILNDPNIDIATEDADKEANLELKKIKNKSVDTVSVTSINNGFYEDVEVDEKGTWNVNTDDGDVILGFSSLIFEKEFSIEVTGSNELFIYLIDNGEDDIFDAKNKFSVISQGNIPKTYIISYPLNDNNSELKLTIDNRAELKAYFYLPGCSFEIENSNNGSKEEKIYGSIYAEKVKLKNNDDVVYVPYPSGSILKTNNSGGETSEVTNYEAIFLTSPLGADKYWLR